MEDQKRCDHPACNCEARDGSDFCSPYCESAGETPDVTCDCGHPECMSKL